MNEFLPVVNAARAKARVAPLAVSQCLMDSADAFARYMQIKDTRSPPAKYKDLGAKIQATGKAYNIKVASEMVGRGYDDEASAAKAFLSQGNTLLDPKYTVIGVGMDVGEQDSRRYWAVHVMTGSCPSRVRSNLSNATQTQEDQQDDSQPHKSANGAETASVSDPIDYSAEDDKSSSSTPTSSYAIMSLMISIISATVLIL
eukprot:gene13906-16406_t